MINNEKTNFIVIGIKLYTLSPVYFYSNEMVYESHIFVVEEIVYDLIRKNIDLYYFFSLRKYFSAHRIFSISFYYLILLYFSLNEILTLDDLYTKLITYIDNNLPIERINDLSLVNLFYFVDIYPNELHTLFCCLLIRLINPKYNDKENVKLFRCLINLINNYYINQQDLLDDNRYRLMIVYLVSKFLCEIHRRRSNNEHEWYYLYHEIPKEHPLPTFDLFSDLLCLLSTLTYNDIDCQNQVRQVSGTIESILSMTQIDLNQPKSQACVTWLIKCLTESNQENRDYIKQIK